MLRKIYRELVLIRKELQAIRSSQEFNLQCTKQGKIEANTIQA